MAVWLVLCPLAARAEPAWSEAELVARALDGAVAVADRTRLEAEATAAGTAPAALANPLLEARHEQANGPAGAHTDAIGGSLALELGMPALAHTRAARLRKDAAPHRRDAWALDTVCTLRREAAELWAATEAARITTWGQERLLELQDTLGTLAELGEASGFDRDLAALARAQHAVEEALALERAHAVRSRLSARVGAPVPGVRLDPLETPLDGGAPHPELAALELEGDAARHDAAGARRAALPGLTVGAAARWDALPDGGGATPGFEVGGALELPLFDRGRSTAREAAAAHARADAARVRREAELSAAAQDARQRIDALARTVEAPRPAAIWVAAQARYVAGEASLEALLHVAERVEAAELAEVERAHRLRLARVDLACATGRLTAPGPPPTEGGHP